MTLRDPGIDPRHVSDAKVLMPLYHECVAIMTIYLFEGTLVTQFRPLDQ